MGKVTDVCLTFLVPLLVILHLIIAPYTKVEESFNIQATHDIATYGLDTEHFDHVTFPGAVPRTFVGALTLAGVSKPLLGITEGAYGQFIIRAHLGLFNAWALLKYKNRLEEVFGKDVGNWYVLLQATQFHVIYYASRTLPNMFAFGLTTLALREFIPGAQALRGEYRQKLSIFLFVFAGVVFRSEIALLLATHVFNLLIQQRVTLWAIAPIGIVSALVALHISVPVDSYFWGELTWPEFSGFYFNAIEGKSSEWGTSPPSYYFVSLLPKLLLNPLILIYLIPMGLTLPGIAFNCRDMVLPSAIYIAIYSMQPHKEARFIIYVVPAITGAAALSANYIWTRRSKTRLYMISAGFIVASIIGSFIASTGMLLISSLNYPGGAALARLHDIMQSTPWPDPHFSGQLEHINVHMDVLSCMTGVTRFQQLPSTAQVNGRPTLVKYDKTENETLLLWPEFWHQFDYALMEDQEKAIGKWEVVDTIFAYAGIEILRPGDGSSFTESLERVYAANNITTQDGDAASSEDVKHAVVSRHGKEGQIAEKQELIDLKTKLFVRELDTFGAYNLFRDAARVVTGGWWIGPRMEPRIRILRRVVEP